MVVRLETGARRKAYKSGISLGQEWNRRRRKVDQPSITFESSRCKRNRTSSTRTPIQCPARVQLSRYSVAWLLKTRHPSECHYTHRHLSCFHGFFDYVLMNFKSQIYHIRKKILFTTINSVKKTTCGTLCVKQSYTISTVQCPLLRQYVTE